jgi:hypothetical protein
MKTTVEIPDALLDEARRMAAREGVPVRALIEEGLRAVVASGPPTGISGAFPSSSCAIPWSADDDHTVAS